MSRWGTVLLGGALVAGIGGACGGDEGVARTPDGGGGGAGAAGADASAGETGAAGGSAAAGQAESDAGGASDASNADTGAVDAADGDAAAEGCADAHVLQSDLPDPSKWSGGSPPFGVYVEGRHVWVDAQGIHVAWNANRAWEAGAGSELVLSTYDHDTGALISHRLFESGNWLTFEAVGVAPDGTVGIAVAVIPDDAGASAAFDGLLMVRTDDTSFEKLVPLPSWPVDPTYVVDVAWDGAAFAVHGFASGGTVYVTRIAEDGTVLLQPQAFGIATGYAFESRFSTDPTSGMTYGLTGTSAPTLVAHQRDGTPVPDPPKVMQLPTQGWGADGKLWGSGSSCASLVATPDGAAVALSGAGGEENTFVQPFDTTLAATENVIPLPGKATNNSNYPYDWNQQLTIQVGAGGWWLAGLTTSRSIDEYVVKDRLLTSRRTLVTYSGQAFATGHGFDARYFESVEWNGELWLGFEDNSNTDTGAEHPYRIIRVKPGCTYRSMTDIKHGW